MTPGGLGRRVSEDPRDRAFSMRPLLGLVAAPVPQAKFWRIPGQSIDQGNTGTCVGHAWRNFLRCAPLQGERGASPWEIYRLAVQMDAWDDNDDEAHLPDGAQGLQSGTSIRAGAKALQKLGHMKNYVWANDLTTLMTWVLTQGPVVFGSNWYEPMDNPDKHGVVNISGAKNPVGGHAYLIRGINLNAQLALCENSWGEDWGAHGRFYVRLPDLERLLREEGEACAAVQTYIKP